MTRKTLLQWVYALQLTQAAIMAILVMIGVDNPWYVLMLAIVNGTLRATQQTAAQSLTPNLVPRERLPNAVALNEAMQQGSRAVGPAILLAVSATVGQQRALFGGGGASFSIQNLVLTIGTSAIVFWACAAFYLVALASALSIRTVSSGVIDRRTGVSGPTRPPASLTPTALPWCSASFSWPWPIAYWSCPSSPCCRRLALEKLSPDGITFNENDVYALDVRAWASGLCSHPSSWAVSSAI